MDTADYRRKALLKRWNELKVQFPWQDIRKEWDLYAAWYLKKNKKELRCNMTTLQWFVDSRLKNKPAPPPKTPTLAEFEDQKILLARNQMRLIRKALTDFGMNLSFNQLEVLERACAFEGLVLHTVTDWLNSEGSRPVTPHIKAIYQDVLKFKTK